MMLNLHSLAYPVRALGPGIRVVVWLAGCRKNCPECISPEMQDPDSGRKIQVRALIDRILSLDMPFTGITISGGEPLDQIPPLTEFLEKLRQAHPDWDVLVYSGYTWSQIQGLPESGRLLSHVDVLIDGPFRVNEPSRTPLAGSGNQVVHFLSPRGEKLKKDYDSFSQKSYDLALGSGGRDLLIGVPRQDHRNKVKHLLNPGLTNAIDID